MCTTAQPLVRRHNLILLDTDLMVLVVDLDDLERLLRRNYGEAPSRHVSVKSL